MQCYKELIEAEILWHSPCPNPDASDEPQISQLSDVRLPQLPLVAQSIYWQNIPSYWGDPLKKRCQPLFHSKGFVFRIPIGDLYKCGFTRLVNKLSVSMSPHVTNQQQQQQQHQKPRKTSKTSQTKTNTKCQVTAHNTKHIPFVRLCLKSFVFWFVELSMYD